MARLDEVDGIEQEPVHTAPAVVASGQQQFPAGDAQPSFSYSTTMLIETLAVGQPWTTSLFDCHEHPTNAIMTAFFPCVTFGQIAEVLDEGKLTCPLGAAKFMLLMPLLCSHWIVGSMYRAKLRGNYNLVEAPYTDVISHVFCPLCSLCQEFRELKNRGLDPALGWIGILAQRQAGQNHNQKVVVAPPTQSISR